MNVALQIARLVAVLALVCVAAAIATPKGRLPLALRGLAKMVRGCEGEKARNPQSSHPSAAKRLLAFLLVLLAILLALI